MGRQLLVVLLLSTTTVAQQQLELGELIFSPPVLLDATPGKNLGADSFAAIDVDPAGEATLIYGTGHWTSYLLRPTKCATKSVHFPLILGRIVEMCTIRSRYDSGKTWESKLPNGAVRIFV